jgi:tetratricopeptide (TPR) repeat protein
VPPDQVDVRRFERLLSSARAAAAAPNPERARALLLEAEELWGGEPLEGLTGQWAQATRQSLNERLRAAVLARIDLDLRLGEHGDHLISELTALTGTGRRIDQNAIGLLMRALNNAGRQDEALATFRRARARLHDELGVNPSPELEALHQRILSGDPTLMSPSNGQYASGGPAPDTLDRDLPQLIGRDDELRDLLAGVGVDLRAGSTAIYALDGMPGVGKSALAVRAAHRLRAHCPDGLLQINLRTHHPQQPEVDPRGALTQLLEAISTPAGELGRAGSLDALAALWRRRNNGRRLLVLLDDVHDAEQISPLLPTTPGSIVLITSRRRISGLTGARQHTVRPLADDAASTLLTQITGRDFSADHDQLARFTRHCGGMPLAITVSAAHLRARPTWGLNDIVELLTTAVASAADDSPIGPIRAAFAMSYRTLTPAHRTLLRRVAAHPGDSFSWHAAAVMAAAPLDETNLALDVLHEHHLIDEIERHRYRLHDLLRLFALTQIREESDSAASDEAVGRVLEFYLATAARAESVLRPYRRGLDEPAGPSAWVPSALDSSTAQAWLDDESANLMAVAAYAHERGWSRYASRLPYVLAQHLDRRGHWSQAVDMLRKALETVAAQESGVRSDVVSAQLLTDLAAALVRRGDLDAALSAAERALDAWIACDDERGQADALIEIGRSHWHSRRPDAAVAAFERAAACYGRVGDRRGQGVAGYHLSAVLFERGDTEAARKQMHEVLKTAQLLNDLVLQSETLTNLGEIYRLMEDRDKALHYFRLAQPLADRHGNPHIIAVLASNIGAVHDRNGDYESALASFSTALPLFQAMGDRRNEIDVLLNLARAYIHLRDYEASFARIERATLLAEQIHDPLRHARVHLETGRLHQAQSRHSTALDSYRASLDYARQAAAPLDQAHAHHALSDALRAVNDASAAREHWAQAQHLYRQLGHHDINPIAAT